MNLTPHALLFTLSAIGIAETAYLLRQRQAHQSPICVIGQGCTKVLESKFNRLLGVPNDLLGLLFYLAIATLTASLVIEVGPLVLIGLVAKLMIVGASCMSVVLTWIQWKLIKSWCFWCLMSAGTILLMLFIILIAII